MGFTLITFFLLGILSAISSLDSCTVLGVKSEEIYSVKYNTTIVCCDNWCTSYCNQTTSYVASEITNYEITECCPGHGGDNCYPQCDENCGPNQECSAPNNCTCTEGWMGKDCNIDINECISGTNMCEFQETCENYDGSYNCSCYGSDKLAANGRRCLSPITNLQAEPNQRNITLTWNIPFNLTYDGLFQHYDLFCKRTGKITGEYATNETTEMTIITTMSTLMPFTNYTCCVTPVWIADDFGPQQCIDIQTLQDSPNGPPLNVTISTVDSMILRIEWFQPEFPNGIIQYYTLYLNYTNSSNIYMKNIDPEYSAYLLQNLFPYQFVGISISATTGGGEGPQSAFKFNRTAQSTPGEVDDLDVEILSPAAVRITWKPPSSMNGIILNYYITLIKIIQDERSIVNEWELQFSDNHLVEVSGNLEPYIPYQVEVIASTVAGKGKFSPYDFFTVEKVPRVPPAVESVARNSPTDIYISWNILNGNDLRGILVDYIVKYSESRVNCSYTINEETQATVNGYITLQNLNPQSAYCIQVAAATSVGAGNYSELFYVNMYESSFFELHVNGLHDCKLWSADDTTLKLSDVVEKLTEVVNLYCSCHVQSNYFGNLRFFCDDRDITRVIIQGQIVGSVLESSTKLVEYIEQWKDASPTIVIEGLELTVNSSCDVAIDSLESHTDCYIAPQSTLECEDDSSVLTNYIVSAIIGAAFGAVVAFIVAIVVAIVFICVKKSRHERI